MDKQSTMDTTISVAQNDAILGGASGMRNGEHKGPVDLSPNKFYVMARGRYKSFEKESSDDDRDWRHELPMEAPLVWNALIESLTERTMKKVKQELNNLSGQNDAYASFILSLWYPLVKQNLDAFNGLLTDSEHNPMMHSHGSFCYDVKICRLMKRKLGQDLDINGDLTRTRAAEMLRIIHTKLNLLPRETLGVLFQGLGSKEIWPQNEADEPFSAKTNEDFGFADEYKEGNLGPYFKAIQTTWGQILCIVKRDHIEEFDQSEYGQYDAQAPPEPEAEPEAEPEPPLAPPPKELPRRRSPRFRGGLTETVWDSLKGGKRHNKFGTPNELEELEWISDDGGSALGIMRTKDHSVVLAYVWTDSMPELWTKAKLEGQTLLWVPPEGPGKADGYFSNDLEDYDAMTPWASHFKTTSAKSLKKPSNKKHMLTYKAIKAGSEGPLLDEFGLRGGHFLWIEQE